MQMLRLHRIHEAFLHLVENQNAKPQHQQHEAETVGQPAPPDELAGTQSSMFEGFNNGSHRIDAHDVIQVETGHDLAFHLAERIDNRRGVHPQGDKEAEKHLQVAVLGGHGGDDNAETQRQACHHQHQQREQQQVPVGAYDRATYHIKQIDNDKQSELDAEPDQVAHRVGERHDQPREIDLPEYVRVGHKGVGGLGEAIRKVLPHADTAQVEERLRNAVGRDAGDAAEHHHVHNHGKCRLDQPPERPQDGLLVLGDDVTFHEKGKQITVIPHLLQIDLEEFVPRFDDGRPFFLIGRQISAHFESIVRFKHGFARVNTTQTTAKQSFAAIGTGVRISYKDTNKSNIHFK